MSFDRLPSIPLVTNDPYFSIWLPHDTPTDVNTVHWTDAPKRIQGVFQVDGKRYGFLGRTGCPVVPCTNISVTPTTTRFDYEADGAALTVRFRTPALPEDPDILSTPITFLDYEVKFTDGKRHDVAVQVDICDELCYDGRQHPAMRCTQACYDGLNVLRIGQAKQNVLCHSGDWITIDWGWLHVASTCPIRYNGVWITCLDEMSAEGENTILLGYDDVASVNYFGTFCKAWYARNGKTMIDALRDFYDRRERIRNACDTLDGKVLEDAFAAGGEDYQRIVSAAWRQTFAAHKLIAAPNGDPVFLSKECDSNGCIGTVDVAYPSIPLFLRYNPELVNALCRAPLEFASRPVWKFDFAPHDVGRYPYATGQIYGDSYVPILPDGEIFPERYLAPADNDIYNERDQMPVEECGNMLIMLFSAVYFGADDSLAKANMDKLGRWARYLDRYGEDPADQLCTDDFAGHMAHNVNLSAKALIAIRCYAELLKHFGDEEGAACWRARAEYLAESWLSRAIKADGTTPLTFHGDGWSLKYNMVWDKLFAFGLMPSDFFRRETESYLPHSNAYGVPLDPRDVFTKSDWLCWCAAMAERDTRRQLLAPIARFLQCSRARVPFPDWYSTVDCDSVGFKARSVQGGVFMPLLTDHAISGRGK